MAHIYHRQEILHRRPGQKCVVRRGRLRALPTVFGAASLALLALLAGCDAVEVAEGSDTHVSIRYDGIANGLDKATQLAQQFCGRYGKTAKLRKTYWEGLGVGERFAFYECI
jgi:hypothetical protein